MTNMSSNDEVWKYSEYSENSLKRFNEVVEEKINNVQTGHGGVNVWQRLNLLNSCENMKFADMKEGSSVTFAESSNSELKISQIISNVGPKDQESDSICDMNVDEFAHQLYEDIRDDNIDDDYYIECINARNFALICSKMAEISSSADIHKICMSISGIFYKIDDSAIETFCKYYLITIVKRKLFSRNFENAVIHIMLQHPTELCEHFIIPLIYCSDTVEFLVNSSIITKLKSDHKILIFKHILELPSEEIKECVLSVILMLFKLIPIDSLLDLDLMITQFLVECSTLFYKNVEFGKLLHSIVQNLPPERLILLENRLEYVIANNQSPFKISCQSLLKSKLSK